MAAVLIALTAYDPTDANLVTVTNLDPGDTTVTFRRLYGNVAEDIPGVFIPEDGSYTLADYLYPLDTPVTYQVWSGNRLTLLATSSPTGAVASGGYPWIRDVVFPALRYARVIIVDTGAPVRPGRVAQYVVVNRPMATTVGDVRSGRMGTFTLFCQSHAERDAVLYAMSTGNPCSLRVPSECRSVVDELLFTPIDITETRFGAGGRVVLSVDYVEVDMSDVASFKPVTYGAQTQNAVAATLLYGSLAERTGLAGEFYGHTYADMYVSPTGIEP